MPYTTPTNVYYFIYYNFSHGDAGFNTAYSVHSALFNLVLPVFFLFPGQNEIPKENNSRVIIFIVSVDLSENVSFQVTLKKLMIFYLIKGSSKGSSVFRKVINSPPE